eukprot:TRINITY_DN7635_c1_g1_i1.p4 TRINITY_DN7635_c1_g1~~TRINITY_DN7635_c1_g1_i1.p4  ORF type:complete len:221 (-),score=39.19 TRINITY_DN7635_c1_g1_i1:285-947(-)
MAKGTSRNPELISGINKLSRGAAFAKHRRFRKRVAPKAAAPKTAAAVKYTPFSFPTERVKRPLASNRQNKRPTKLRASITPGTVLILLAGHFRGSRVVFLKQLESGLLLVTGPFHINGVPLRRVNQAYVNATSTKVDVSGVKLDKFNDAYFAPQKEEKEAKKAHKETKSNKKYVAPARVADQKEIDAVLVPQVKKTPFLAQYLASRFSLSTGQFPHDLKL